MKLWLLRGKEGLPKDGDPWRGYDVVHGFVIRAESEADARQFAHEAAGDENDA